MFKRILLTVDLGHPASWKTALPTAVDLARQSDGELHVMTAVPAYGSPIVAGYLPPDMPQKSMEAAKSALVDLIAKEVPEDVRATPHVAYGTVHEEVLKYIGDTNADIVVMASHAPDRVREFLVGSQADRVVRRSPVSVLVVRG